MSQSQSSSSPLSFFRPRTPCSKPGRLARCFLKGLPTIASGSAANLGAEPRAPLRVPPADAGGVEAFGEGDLAAEVDVAEAVGGATGSAEC